MIEIHPDLDGVVQLGVIEATDVSVKPTTAEHRSVLTQLAAEYARDYKDVAPSEVPGIRAVRKLFHHTGLDPTRYRPSSEALFRRAVRGKDLYFINSAVDLVNYWSLKLLIPMGLFDADKVDPPIEFRIGRQGETYEGIGRSELNLYHFPLLVDRQGPFGSPVSDSMRTRVDEETRHLLWVVIAPAGVSFPFDDLVSSVVRWNGGRVEAQKILPPD